MAASDTLADATARAAQWRFAGTLVGSAARLGVGVLLARLLPPVDFGIIALALVVTGFAQPFGDLGVASAVVQRRDLTSRHVRAAFTFSVAVGFFVAGLLVLGAPFAALVVRDDRVTPVLRVLSLGFAVQGFSVVAVGLLRRRLNFRRLFFIETVSYLIGYGLLAVSLAILGFGIWSLVWGSLVQSTVSAVWQLISARHSMNPLLAGRELGDLLHYGVGAGATSMVNYVALNADNFLVGRLLGATSLGLYSRAYNLMNLPYVYAASVMSGVLFPAFAQLQADIPRLRRGYLTTTKLTAMVAGPSMCTLAIAAPFLVPAVYGPQWAGVVLPLQILCAAGYFRALYHVGGVVAHSVGRVYSELWLQIGYATLVIVGAMLGSTFALPGVAVGVGVAIIYMFFATGQLVLRITRTTWIEYIEAQRPAALTSAAVTAVGLAALAALEQMGARNVLIALGVLAACGIPWAVGLLWSLGASDLAPVTVRLPKILQELVHSLRRFSTPTANFRA